MNLAAALALAAQALELANNLHNQKRDATPAEVQALRLALDKESREAIMNLDDAIGDRRNRDAQG